MPVWPHSTVHPGQEDGQWEADAWPGVLLPGREGTHSRHWLLASTTSTPLPTINRALSDQTYSSFYKDKPAQQPEGPLVGV